MLVCSKHIQDSSLIPLRADFGQAPHSYVSLQLFATVIHHSSLMSCVPCMFWPALFDLTPFFPASTTPALNPNSVIERLRQISHSTTALQISVFVFPLPPSLPLAILLYCLPIVEETVAQTNGERRYPLVNRKIGVKEQQRESQGEEDTWADMRVKLITGECQLEGTVMGLFASPWHPKNITISHHVYPLRSQDRSSHQPSLETACKLKVVTAGEHAGSVCRHD